MRRLFSVIGFLVLAWPAHGQEANVCEAAAVEMRNLATQARALHTEADRIGLFFVVSDPQTIIDTLEASFAGQELAAMLEFAESYRLLAPLLLNYVDRAESAASALEACPEDLEP